MELFDKRFVHFMWDDELEGKEVFTADDMETLIKAVNNNHSRREVSHTISNLNTAEYDLRTPFRNADTLTVHQFAYYDPNYEVKKAFNEGKTIQFLSRQQQLTGEWIDVWYDCVGPNEPKFLEKVEYRVKPECPCEDGIDSKACVGCEYSEDGKKKYRPYESSAEMIVDLIDRFKVNCPSYCEPLVWVKVKSNDARFLVTGFGYKVSVDGVSYSLDELFKYYAYLDGSPCGKEC